MSPPATNSARAPTANPVVSAIPPVAVSAVGVAVAVGLAVAVEVALAVALAVALGVALAVPLAMPLAMPLADASVGDGLLIVRLRRRPGAPSSAQHRTPPSCRLATLLPSGQNGK